jgi:hypothetical protein
MSTSTWRCLSTFGIRLSLMTLALWPSLVTARSLHMRDSRPSAEAVIQGRHAEYVIYFDGPVDHAASRLQNTQSGRLVQELHPRLNSAVDALFASGEARGPILPPLGGEIDGRRCQPRRYSVQCGAITRNRSNARYSAGARVNTQWSDPGALKCVDGRYRRGGLANHRATRSSHNAGGLGNGRALSWSPSHPPVTGGKNATSSPDLICVPGSANS